MFTGAGKTGGGSSVSTSDTYFNRNVLSVHGNGANGAANGTYIDSSDWQPYAPFADTYSISFNSTTSDYLSIATSGAKIADLGFGTGAFTVEFWVYLIAAPNTWNALFDINTYTTGILCRYQGTSTGAGADSLYFGGTSYSWNPEGNVSFNKWTHIALSRQTGGAFALYVNGVSAVSGTNAANLGTTGYMQINGGLHAAGQNCTAYYSNFRIVKGQALYTGAFTPPTAAFTTSSVGTTGANVAASITGTVSLLTCQTANIEDTSGSNLTIVRNGMPLPATGYYNHPFASTYSTQFNGSNSYIQASSTSAFALGTSNFTLEFWMNAAALPSAYGGLVLTNQPTDYYGLALYLNSSGQFYLLVQNVAGSSWQTAMTSSNAIKINTWYHVALVRNGNVFTLYCNGVSVGTATYAVTLANTNNLLTIGARPASTQYFNGFISNLRLTLNQALFTGTFVPALSTLTSNAVVHTGSNVSLLNGSAVLIANQSSSATVDNSDYCPNAPFPSAYSYSFNGSTDYFDASIPSTTVSGDFTIESWVNFGANASSYAISDSSSTALALALYLVSGTTLRLTIGGTAIVNYTFTPNVNQWYHVAVTRSGSTVTMYVNGVSVGTATSSASVTLASGMRVGRLGGASSGYFNGYISNYRFVNGTAVYSSAFTPPFATLTAVSNTVLLTCHSESLSDGSTNAATITRAGRATLPLPTGFVYHPFNTSTYSTYFSGTSDYVASSVSSSGFAFGTGDWTLEMWINSASFANRGLFQSSTASGAMTATSGSGGIQLYLQSTGALGASINGTWTNTPTTVMAANQWYHVALVKYNNAVKLYVNGVADSGFGSVADTTNYTATYACFGGYYSTAFLYIGYISNLRVVKGTAVYTSNFTPPTSPLTAIAGTALLACQSSAAGTDNSGNTLGLTVNGSPKITNGNLAITSSGTVTTFNGPLSNVITKTGNPTQSSFSPFSPNGWSNYFDGSGYLTYSSSSALSFSTNDFTVEAWIYVTSVGNGFNIFNVGGASNGSYSLYVYSNSGNKVQSTRYGDTAGAGTTATTISLNTWYHVAAVRISGTMKVYINGVADASATYSMGSVTNTGATTGTVWNTQSTATGYISNLRVIKGTGVYTGDFTPSTTPLTAISGTQLLTCQSNRFLDNSTNGFSLVQSGNLSVQAFSPFAPAAAYDPALHGGSIYLSGSDYITYDYLTNSYAVGTGDFTIECWCYATTVSDAKAVFNLASGTSYQFLLRLASTTSWQIYPGNTTVAYDPANNISSPLNQWTHVVMTRSSSTIRTYINGVCIYTAANTTNYTAENKLTLGYYAGYYWTGYISGLKLTRGVSLYGSSSDTATYVRRFTPPTSLGSSASTTATLQNAGNGSVIDTSTKTTLLTVGNATVRTTAAKFGTGSLNLTAGGGSNYIQGLANNFYAFGTADFTVEAWIYMTGTPGSWGSIWSSRGTPATSVFLGFNAGTLNLMSYLAAYQILDSSGSVPLNTWTHVALVRYSGTTKLYKNGTSVGSAADSTSYTGTNCYIGYEPQAGAGFTGYIDDLRITRGYARYTANFTPPTSTFFDK